MKKLALALVAIVLVAGVAIAATTQWRERQRQKREIADVKEAYLALAMYRSDQGQFPAQLVDLVPNYLTEEVHQRVATYHYSPETPNRLLVRTTPQAETIVRADGSAAVERSR